VGTPLFLECENRSTKEVRISFDSEYVADNGIILWPYEIILEKISTEVVSGILMFG